MRSFLVRAARWLIVPVLLLLGIVSGGLDGVVGWFFLAWMLFRGGPGMWQDVRRFFGFMRGRSLVSLVRRRSSSGAELNA